MNTDFSYNQITVPTLDKILSSLRSQPVMLMRLLRHYAEVQFWETVRRAKQAEQAQREGA